MSEVSAPHQYETLTLVEVEIQVRPEYNGKKPRSSCLGLTGRKMILEVMWKQNENDPYPGEFALGDSHRAGEPDRLYHLAAITWVSSGDVKFIRVVPRTELLPNSKK